MFLLSMMNRGPQGFRRHLPGGAKHWDRVHGQRHFSYNIHIGVRKIHLHIFFNFLKNCGNDQLILTFLIKYWVSSDIWTEFHLNQRQARVETR